MKLKILFIILIILSIPKTSRALNAAVYIPDKYMDVQSGDQLYFQLDVKYPENPTRIDLRLDYTITDESGKTIAEAQALKAVETQSSFMDYLAIPENTPSGLHKVNISIRDYGKLNENAGTSFQVSNKKMDRSTIYFIISMGAIFLLAILVIVDMLRKRKSQNL
jgi:hypothetical protein